MLREEPEGPRPRGAEARPEGRKPEVREDRAPVQAGSRGSRSRSGLRPDRPASARAQASTSSADTPNRIRLRPERAGPARMSRPGPRPRRFIPFDGHGGDQCEAADLSHASPRVVRRTGARRARRSHGARASGQQRKENDEGRRSHHRERLHHQRIAGARIEYRHGDGRTFGCGEVVVTYELTDPAQVEMANRKMAEHRATCSKSDHGEPQNKKATGKKKKK